ncbi:MAG: aminopeptidase N [Alphaproteobacteria bacterium]|nr:aminopeptidase N [Alphaproteobacteria bacterium]
MREPPGQLVKRLDYQASAYLIDSVDLTFDLDPAKTRVLNRMRMRRNPDVAPQPLRLDGEELNLARVLVNGEGTSFKMDNGQLLLEKLPEGHEPFDLEIFTTCNPLKNTTLSGLYVSQNTFFTQCEAEGFRRITYFLDRPDIMASYSVTLRADATAYPVLLSNGNLIEEGRLDDGRHFARWVDPHRKPCYLFALVAGRLVCREQRIRSRLGGEHLLQVYVRAGDLDKTEHAMQSLMHSIAWDEARFGLSLDLERFMIVATSDFNMGAMENKGLNIFNTKYVLANPATATDIDFDNVESVVAHEYFHNWTGNRVTCRDWFQLSLKEGLTVFRDQEFSQDLAGSPSARAVKRIEDVRLLRNVQFAEDAGPMAHPVRPDSYLEINNFYTVTIYEKGAEVVRMMQTLVGRDGFARGMKLYFDRHDGQAVTCDDFAQAMADVNPGSPLAQHLEAFKRWYSQAGTPALKVTTHFDATQRRYTLTVRQFSAPSPGQVEKLPFVIPIQLGLLSSSGRELVSTNLQVLTEVEQSWTFEDIDEAPVPSLLRDFSAPVTLHYPYTRAELLTLLAHDRDPFNRWEAAQRLCLEVAVRALQQGHAPELGEELSGALRQVLRHPDLDAAFKELVLTLPCETYMGEQLETVDPQRVHSVREALRTDLARQLRSDWQWAYETHRHQGAYVPNAEQSGRRALAGLALSMLCLYAVGQGDEVWQGKTLQAFKDAGNMTDRFNALTALVQSGSTLANNALQRFHALYRHEALVIDKWFALQAGACDRSSDVLPNVRQLLRHPDFEIKNPNRARSLIFSYCNGNPAGFHRSDASGYVLWAEKVIEIDGFNPQVAARLARALDRWRKLAEPYRGAAHEAIARVAAKADLSSDVREVVSRALTE